MSRLTERLRRLQWMAVPLAAYVTVTLLLPAARGASSRPGFAVHAAWVLGGCALAAAIAIVGGELVHLVARALRRSPARSRSSSSQRLEEPCEP